MASYTDAQINAWVDQIMTDIDETIESDYRNSRGQRMPKTVASFSELHDYVDANMYLIDAGVPYGAGDDEVWNAVADEVSRRLAARQPDTKLVDLLGDTGRSC